MFLCQNNGSHDESLTINFKYHSVRRPTFFLLYCTKLKKNPANSKNIYVIKTADE